MLRSTAIGILNEIQVRYPTLLEGTTQLSLDLSDDGSTKIIIKSLMNIDQKNSLINILKQRGLKVAERPFEFGTFLTVY